MFFESPWGYLFSSIASQRKNIELVSFQHASSYPVADPTGPTGTYPGLLETLLVELVTLVELQVLLTLLDVVRLLLLVLLETVLLLLMVMDEEVEVLLDS